MIFNLELGKQSSPGINRPQNEDNIGYYLPQEPEILLLRGQIFLVADGSGEEGNGEIASKIAIQTVIQEFYDAPWVGSVEEMLLKAIKGTPIKHIPITANKYGKRMLNVTVMKDLGIRPKRRALVGTELVRTSE